MSKRSLADIVADLAAIDHEHSAKRQRLEEERRTNPEWRQLKIIEALKLPRSLSALLVSIVPEAKFDELVNGLRSWRDDYAKAAVAENLRAGRKVIKTEEYDHIDDTDPQGRTIRCALVYYSDGSIETHYLGRK